MTVFLGTCPNCKRWNFMAGDPMSCPNCGWPDEESMKAWWARKIEAEEEVEEAKQDIPRYHRT